MHFHPWFLALLLIPAGARAADAGAFQKLVDEAVKAGGGTVTIPPGTHTLPRGLLLRNAQRITVIGTDRDRCILQLPPLAFTECAQVTPAGATELITAKSQHITPGMRLWIEAPGAVDSFTQKPTNYHLAVVKSVEQDRLTLTTPLQFPVPAGTQIRDADAANLIEIRGSSQDILVRNLTLDGGRTPQDPPVRGHAQLCGVFAAGPYNYGQGPTGPKVKGVVVEDCVIRNCFGRGVAFYCVENCRIEHCLIADTNDEAVDFDHFTTNSEARGNHITRCHVAFELNDATDCLIVSNKVRDCGTAVNLWRWCKQEGLNEGNRMLNNTFLHTAGNAVQLGQDTRRNTVAGNEITGCGKNGIVLQGEQQHIEDNRISGVKLKPVTE